LLQFTNANADNLLKSAIALHFVDWAQTREIVKNDQFYEKNKLLGENPTLAKVNVYMASTMIIMLGIDRLLPVTHKVKFRIFWVIIGAIYVAGNYSIGVRIGI